MFLLPKYHPNYVVSPTHEHLYDMRSKPLSYILNMKLEPSINSGTPILSLLLGSQQLDLCSALKETLSVFSVSANWPAGRAAGLQQPASAAVNIK